MIRLNIGEVNVSIDFGSIPDRVKYPVCIPDLVIFAHGLCANHLEVYQSGVFVSKAPGLSTGNQLEITTCKKASLLQPALTQRNKCSSE